MASAPEQPRVFDPANLRVRIHKTRERVQRELRGHRALCLRPIDRLAALCDVLAELDDARRQPVEKKFADAVAVYRKAIGWQVHYPWMLYWIATGQRLVGQVHDMHMRISSIYEALGLAEVPELADTWCRHWAAEYNDFVRWLIEEADQFSAPRFRAQMGENPIKIREFLATIKLQLAVYDAPAHNMDAADHDMEAPDHDMDAPDHEMVSPVSPEMIGLMRRTLETLVVDPTVDPGKIFTWYIPKEDVTFDLNASFSEGSFGVLYQGTWTRSEEPVGVKIMDETGDGGAEFSREFNTWWRLCHPNILTMHGANHVAKKRFFVCELASDYNLVTFFQDGGNRELLWTKFHMAAEGLAFLHKNKVQHGGIKSSNLLLAADGVVKLSDFGLSVVRDQSKSLSKRSKEHGTRYMAPEELTETDASINHLQADVYSLGLCVIEAVTGNLPFDSMDDKDVFESKRRHDPVNRPLGFSDGEWALVASMVDNDPDQRPTAAQLVLLMSAMHQ